jgi:hypothetical protein
VLLSDRRRTKDKSHILACFTYFEKKTMKAGLYDLHVFSVSETSPLHTFKFLNA